MDVLHQKRKSDTEHCRILGYSYFHTHLSISFTQMAVEIFYLDVVALSIIKSKAKPVAHSCRPRRRVRNCHDRPKKLYPDFWCWQGRYIRSVYCTNYSGY